MAVVEFTASDLLVGGGGETAARPADLPDTVPPPYDESEQTLRVVAFTIPGQPDVEAADLPGGSGTVTRTTVSGGQLRFRFEAGAFVEGDYRPAADFNERSTPSGSETFGYIVEDDGKTTIPGAEGGPIFLDPRRSQPAEVELRVLPANDPPTFDFQPQVNVLERDDRARRRFRAIGRRASCRGRRRRLTNWSDRPFRSMWSTRIR